MENLPESQVGDAPDDLDSFGAEQDARRPAARLAVAELHALADAASGLRAMRLAAGRTQAELGESAGIAQSAVSSYEDPEHMGKKVTTLARLAAGLGWRFVPTFVPLGVDARSPSAATTAIYSVMRSAPDGERALREGAGQRGGGYERPVCDATRDVREYGDLARHFDGARGDNREGVRS